jgi:Mannosyltransferase (PIG-V)
MDKKPVHSRYAGVLVIYIASRLVIALGFYFTAFFTNVVTQADSLPPHFAHLQQKHFRWLSGDSEVILPPPPPGATTLFLEAWPLRAHLEVAVRVAGEEVQPLILLEGVHEYQIPLPRGAVEEASQSRQPLHLAFRSAAYRPQDLTQERSQDSRLLAFALTRLSYFPTDWHQLRNTPLFTRGAHEVESLSGDIDLQNFFRAALVQWDAKWYRDIIELGYTYQAGLGGEQRVRFFPLYPLICRALRMVPLIGWLPVDLVMWGVANAFTIGAVLLFCDLASKTLVSEAAWIGVVLFCFFPGSLFFALPYPESLMALLTVLFLRFLQAQQFTLAALASGLATACRPTGVALIPAFVWAYYMSDQARRLPLGRKLLSGAGLFALSASGVAAYALYLYGRFGDPLAFTHTQLAVPAWPQGWAWAMGSGQPIWRTILHAFAQNPLSLFIAPSAFSALALTAALVLLVIMMIERGPVIWLIIGISLIAMPYGILSGTNLGVISMSRFLAVDIPLFLFGGALLSRYEGLRWLPCIAAILALVLFVYAALYAMGGYFIG